jgi:hypothetical protein
MTVLLGRPGRGRAVADPHRAKAADVCWAECPVAVMGPNTEGSRPLVQPRGGCACASAAWYVHQHGASPEDQRTVCQQVEARVHHQGCFIRPAVRTDSLLERKGFELPVRL